MSKKQPRGKYTLEFKQEGVRQVRAGQSAAAVARSLGIPKASLSNWVRLDARGQLGHRAVTLQIDVLVLETSPEPFDEDIIQRPAASIYADGDAGGF